MEKYKHICLICGEEYEDIHEDADLCDECYKDFEPVEE